MSRSDKGRRARANGAGFERQIARDLRDWLSEEWTVSRVKTSYQAEAGGEFQIEWHAQPHPPHMPVFPVAIECKRDAGFKTDQLWKPGVSAAFRAFWSQACEQAETVGKRPWLILREPPRGPILLVMRREDWTLLNGVMARDGVPVMRFAALVAVPWSAFLEAVPASALSELPDHNAIALLSRRRRRGRK